MSSEPNAVPKKSRYTAEEQEEMDDLIAQLNKKCEPNPDEFKIETSTSSLYQWVTCNQLGCKFVLIQHKHDPVLQALLKDDYQALYDALGDPINKEIMDYPRFNFNMPPLRFACLNGQMECAQVLLENGANPFAADPSGSSGIHMACFHGHLDILHFMFDDAFKGRERFLKKMANKRCRSGSTPLHYAVCGTNPLEVVKFLLKKKASTLVPDNVGRLPACICKDAKTKFLLCVAEKIHLAENKEKDKAAGEMNQLKDSQMKGKAAAQ